jgi:nitrile hydratase
MSASKKKPWSSYRPSPGRKFEIGDRVTIQFNEAPGHRRTPVYIRGKTGVIERVCGAFRNPEERAYGFDGLPERVLYRVRFRQNDVWPAYTGAGHDLIELEIFEHWLIPA